MNIIIDTHIFLWLVYDTKKVNRHHFSLIKDVGNRIFISVISIAELMIKKSVGTLEIDINILDVIEDKSYLENAYKKIQERTDAMSDELKQKFLNYPIPKQIIQEWEGVS